MTTDRQERGRGRRDRPWAFFPGNLAASFTLGAGPRPALASLEVGVLVARFLGEAHGKDVRLKWPNDLVVRGLKCGGVLMGLVDGTLVCGLGLNLRGSPGEAAGAARLFDGDAPEPVPTALAIYRYVLDGRLSARDAALGFRGLCAHLGERVLVQDGGEAAEGVFTGVDVDGGAVLRTGDGALRTLYTGSLTVPGRRRSS